MKGALPYPRALALVGAALVFLALNTGGNLAYLLAAWLAAHAVVGARRVAAARAALALERRLPERLVAGTPAVYTLAAENRSRSVLPAVRLAEPGDAPEREIWFSGFAPGERLDARLELPAGPRGIRFLPAPLLSAPSAFEFTRPAPADGASFVLVHPRAAPVAPLDPELTADLGIGPADRAGDADFAGLARARLGERPSHLHWPAYARTGVAHRKVFVERSSDTLLLFLLAIDPATIDVDVEQAAGYARSLREAGTRFVFASLGEKLSRPIDGEFERDLLDHLALLPARTIPLLPERAGAAVAAFGIPRALVLLPHAAPLDEGGIAAAAGPVTFARVLRLPHAAAPEAA